MPSIGCDNPSRRSGHGGLRHAALFGSVARGDERATSDIDILIELDPAANMTAFDYTGLKNYICGLFDRPVDVVNRDSLKAHIVASAAADAIDEF